MSLIDKLGFATITSKPEIARTVAIFDTETTGLIKPNEVVMDKQPYITEMYVLKLGYTTSGQWVVLGEYDKMFSVPIPITPEITKITGIKEEDLAGKPSFGDESSEIAQFFIGVDELVAHNCSFDRSMLANELSRCGKVLKFPWPPVHTCTVEKTLHYEHRRMSLTNLHLELFGEEFPNAHRAKNDVLPLARCYIELCSRGDIK